MLKGRPELWAYCWPLTANRPLVSRSRIMSGTVTAHRHIALQCAHWQHYRYIAILLWGVHTDSITVTSPYCSEVCTLTALPLHRHIAVRCAHWQHYCYIAILLCSVHTDSITVTSPYCCEVCILTALPLHTTSSDNAMHVVTVSHILLVRMTFYVLSAAFFLILHKRTPLIPKYINFQSNTTLLVLHKI
jgi:hypothetical protein